VEPFPNLASLSDEDLKTEIDKLAEILAGKASPPSEEPA
jgi:hypothetical protein